MKNLVIAVSTLAIILAAGASAAAEVKVQMTKLGSTGAELVFEPELTRIAVGDTVTFIPCDKSLNVETIAGMLPKGAAHIKGRHGRKLSVTFTVPGVYGVKSGLQFNRGMVGVVIVGDDAPIPTGRLVAPDPAQARLESIMASVH